MFRCLPLSATYTLPAAYDTQVPLDPPPVLSVAATTASHVFLAYSRAAFIQDLLFWGPAAYDQRGYRLWSLAGPNATKIAEPVNPDI